VNVDAHQGPTVAGHPGGFQNHDHGQTLNRSSIRQIFVKISFLLVLKHK
jgi:hypothetical protein